MGFFIQISNDSGRPIFQAARNYPDVSFASSALFHALVTASLEQGFVPGLIRSDDATIALAVHGEPGARLGLAMVTSEFASGRTRDLETRLRWRLEALYQGARLILGQDLQKAAGGHIQAETARRLLTERLSPVVSQLMSEEEDSQASTASDPFGWSLATPRYGSGLDASRPLPPLGLRLCGATVEWLLLGCSNIAEHALNDLLKCLDVKTPAGAEPEEPSGHFGALIWHGRVVAATQAWRQAAEMDRGLLVAIANCVGPPAFGEASRTLALEDMSDLWLRPRQTGPKELVSDDVFCNYRMLNVRLYHVDSLLKQDSRRTCNARDMDATSLVLSVLTQNSSTFFAQADVLKRLRESAARLSAEGSHGSLQRLWHKLMHKSSANILELDRLSAVVLLDERTRDSVALPSPWDVTADDTDVCASFRHLVYWIHALPPLDANHPQQFVCCEGYTIAGVRREDNIICWGSAPTSTKQMHGTQDLVLQSIQRLLRRLPRATDLWSSIGVLETPESPLS